MSVGHWPSRDICLELYPATISEEKIVPRFSNKTSWQSNQILNHYLVSNMAPVGRIDTDVKETEYAGDDAFAGRPRHGILATSDRREEAMGRNLEALPKGYFHSVRFIGSYCV